MLSIAAQNSPLNSNRMSLFLTSIPCRAVITRLLAGGRRRRRRAAKLAGGPGGLSLLFLQIVRPFALDLFRLTAFCPLLLANVGFEACSSSCLKVRAKASELQLSFQLRHWSLLPSCLS